MPLLYFRQFSEFIQATQKESEGTLFGKEVQGLPDVVGRFYLVQIEI